MILPIVNLNGDRKEVLIEELGDIRAKLLAAVAALHGASYANGRNYQLNSPGDAQLASAEHALRVTQLERIMQEIDMIQYEISMQGRKS